MIEKYHLCIRFQFRFVHRSSFSILKYTHLFMIESERQNRKGVCNRLVIKIKNNNHNLIFAKIFFSPLTIWKFFVFFFWLLIILFHFFLLLSEYFRCIEDSEGQLICDCKHNTAGRDCEKCKSFYFDQPWARATSQEALECQRKYYLFIHLFNFFFHQFFLFFLSGKMEQPHIENCSLFFLFLYHDDEHHFKFSCLIYSRMGGVDSSFYF